MNHLHAAILSSFHGLTDVLISSGSAHLALFTWFFNRPEYGLNFDVAFHLGTLIALYSTSGGTSSN